MINKKQKEEKLREEITEEVKKETSEEVKKQLKEEMRAEIERENEEKLKKMREQIREEEQKHIEEKYAKSRLVRITSPDEMEDMVKRYKNEGYRLHNQASSTTPCYNCKKVVLVFDLVQGVRAL